MAHNNRLPEGVTPAQKRITPAQAYNELVTELSARAKLGKWSEFVRELELPHDIAPALMTGRVELMTLAKPRAMDAEEVGRLYALIRGLIETNQALQEHASGVYSLAHNVARQFKGLGTMLTQLEAYANFQRVNEGEET